MKKLFAFLIVILVLSSCAPPIQTAEVRSNTSTPADVNPSLPTNPPAPTNPPSPTEPPAPTNTAQPVTTNPDLGTLAFGYNLELLLTYDENKWEDIDYSGSFDAIILHGASDCTMHQNFGRGAPEWWQRVTTQESIDGYIFRVEQWTDTQTNQIVLVTYNIDEKDITIAIEPGSDPDACMEAAKEVIDFSVMNDFGPIN